MGTTPNGKRRNQPQEQDAGGGERGPRTTVVSECIAAAAVYACAN